MKEIWTKDEELAKKYGLMFKREGEGEELIVEKFEDLNRALEAEKKGIDKIFLKCLNWKVIPLENLIALKKRIKIIMEVKDALEAKTALQTLEKGADGVLIQSNDEADVKEIMNFFAQVRKFELKCAVIRNIRKIGMGARSCIDTCELMGEDEGMLVGCSSSGLFLIQAETTENPHVPTRPFRVNAGAISLYTLLGNERTSYLSEIKAGDEILIVSRDGSARKSIVVRNKIEWRPLLLIEAEYEGKIIKTITQDAETIRALTPEGSKSVAELSEGDEVIVLIGEGKGRHFGIDVDERIIEK